MKGDSSKKIIRSSFWTFADRFGVMGVQFVANLVLARLLVPADFGIIGILTIFLMVSDTLIDAGFQSALIQKKSPDQEDFSTVFYFNTGLAVVLYAILYLCSPMLSRFFHLPILCEVMRVIGVILIIRALPVMQIVRLKRRMAFRQLAVANIAAYSVATVVAITMAVKGCGVWSLVALQLVNAFCIMIFLGIADRWLPSLAFSFRVLKQLFSYGGYLLAATIMEVVSKNLQGVIVGRKFSATQMGYYTQAQKLDVVSSFTPTQAVVQLVFPLFSSQQHDLPALRKSVDTTIRYVSLLIFLLMGMCIILAPQLVLLLFGDQWLPSAEYYRILCVGGLFVAPQYVTFYSVASLGKSRVLFTTSFYKWGFLIAAILVGMNFGMKGILWGMVLSNVNVFVMNGILASRNVGYKFGRQLLTMLPAAIAFVLAMAVAWLLGTWVIPNEWVVAAAFVLCYVAYILLTQRHLLTGIRTLLHRR